jgi:putative ABC transport system permease protein
MNIPTIHVILYLSLFIIPLLIFHQLEIKAGQKLIIAVIRMSLQLVMVGFYLGYIFKLNNILVNLLWVVMMLAVANLSVLNQTGLSIKKLGMPIFLGMGTSLTLVGCSFIGVIGLHPFINAQYMIPIIGMLLGNMLRYNIIVLSSFYKNLQERENDYLQFISLGASRNEATKPFMSEAIKNGIMPQIGGIATMGLVTLPGMMTGQILGGADPMVAIKYQIIILTANFTAGTLSATLSIIATRPIAFDSYHRLKHDIYKN